MFCRCAGARGDVSGGKLEITRKITMRKSGCACATVLMLLALAMSCQGDPCPAGSFKEEGELCSACPPYSYSPAASISISSCVCSHGYTLGTSGYCVACPAGKYKDVNGSGTCELCAYGKYSDATAAANESTCAACDQWYFSHKGSTHSSNCSAPQASRLQVTATTCLGNTTMRPKCKNSEDCGGSFRGSCANGTCHCQLSVGGLDCTSCPPGTGGESCEVDCMCSGHGRCLRDGACVCGSSYTGTNCSQRMCPAGQEQKRDGILTLSCIPCAAGKFKATNGSVACTLCSLGKYRKYNVSGTTCSDCEAGKYSPAQGASALRLLHLDLVSLAM